jgi:hypothetical protein
MHFAEAASQFLHRQFLTNFYFSFSLFHGILTGYRSSTAENKDKEALPWRLYCIIRCPHGKFRPSPLWGLPTLEMLFMKY